MTRLIERALNLRHGDLGRGALLFLYLFLIITSYVVGKIVRDALFLDKFEAVQLPYVDIAIALLVGFVVAGYVRIGRQVSLRNLLIGSLLSFAATSVLFWWLAHSYQWPWLYPIVYVWIGIFGVLAPAQVWTLANYVLTTREAKRVFGLVGSGAILGWIFAGYFSKAVTRQFGPESLLFTMSLFLTACTVLVVFVWRQRQPAAADANGEPTASEEDAPLNVRESLRLIGSSSYLRAIAVVICVSSFVTTVAGWQFKAIAKQFLQEKVALSIFFGDFNFYAGLICLGTQLFLTSRVLRRFGIGPALFTVPVALFFGSIGVLVWGTLASAVVLKGSDNILRYSIDKSTVELLYLPVPVNVKLQVKSFIDTVIWRLGDGLAGVAVLISATYLHLTAREVSWVNMVLIIGWLSAAYVARRQYVSVLRESIQQHRLDAERASAPVLDRSTTNILVDSLNATDPKDILYALNLFAMAHRRATHPAVRGLLDHPAAEVRQRAVTILDSAGDKAVMPKVEKLLYDEDLGVRTDALLYLTHQARIDPLRRIEQLGDFPDFSIRSAMVAFLAQPGDAQNLEAAGLLLDAMVKETGPDGQRTRLEAARLIGQLPDHFGEQLRELLRDEDADVARRAVRAVGRLRKRRFILRLIEMLGIAELAPDVVEALARFGNRVVGTLRDVLSDPEMSLEVRREIPAVLLRIGTQEAEGVLVENLLQGDTTLRFKIISALNKLHQAHPELTLDAQMIEMVLAAEIMGHYRSYQILGMLGEELESQDPAVCALRDSMNHEVERIFRLLGLQFPNHDLYSVYVGLQSNNPTVHANALEFLDNIFKPQLRSLLVPLLDGEVSVAERVRLANRLVSVKVESREEAVQALMYSEDPWLKSCAAYAVGALGLKSLGPDLDKWADDPDPLLCETVRQAKLRLAKVPEATASRHRG